MKRVMKPPRREEPALNFTLVGQEPLGFSFSLNTGGQNADMALDYTPYVDRDFDKVTIYEEMNSALLFAAPANMIEPRQKM